MEMMRSVWLWAISLLVVSISVTIQWVYRWRNPKCNGILPPGSMGLPLLGETLDLLVTEKSIDIHPFLKERMDRYGPVFKTSVAGRSVVISGDPDFNDFLFKQEGRLVELWYMDSFAKLLRQEATGASGYVHKYLRHHVLSHFGIETLKHSLLPQLECVINLRLQEWAMQPEIQLKDKVAAMIFEFTAKHMLSYEPEKSSDSVVGNLSNFLEGMMSFPLPIPGTAFYRCVKRQQKVVKVISKMVEERMDGGIKKGDFLDQFVEDMRKETFLTKEFATHVLFGILLASFETISTTIVLTVKYLSDHPSSLQLLTEEHEEILLNKKRKFGDPGLASGLDWADYKSMNYTHNVINESLRLANVAPGILRRAVKDVQFNGYTIPKGWAIMVVPAILQLNPDAFEDPLAFNPSRWENIGSNAMAKNFMPFGGGNRQCAGAEYSKVLMAVFLHVLVTKYRWTRIKGGDVIRAPTLGFASDLQISISNKHA